MTLHLFSEHLVNTSIQKCVDLMAMQENATAKFSISRSFLVCKQETMGNVRVDSFPQNHQKACLIVRSPDQVLTPKLLHALSS